MIEFITWLKALAACLITNSHLDKIYPLESLATGGLLGNLLFFAVSGFCLYHIKQPFHKWYLKRLLRIYPAVWIATGICVAVGTYEVYSWHHVLRLFLYPTYYHFIAAILILYIPFYAVAWLAKHSQQPRKVLAMTGIATIIGYAIVYIFYYDTSYYHIDTVEEPMIAFLYFLSMLLGAGFRNCGQKAGKTIYAMPSVLLSVALYAFTKISVGNGTISSAYQLVNQVSIFVLLFSLMYAGQCYNQCLYTIPLFIRKPISFIAGITLEIYLVQYLILRSPIAEYSHYSVNLISVLLCIIAVAWLLHVTVAFLSKGTLPTSK